MTLLFVYFVYHVKLAYSIVVKFACYLSPQMSKRPDTLTAPGGRFLIALCAVSLVHVVDIAFISKGIKIKTLYRKYVECCFLSKTIFRFINSYPSYLELDVTHITVTDFKCHKSPSKQYSKFIEFVHKPKIIFLMSLLLKLPLLINVLYVLLFTIIHLIFKRTIVTVVKRG